MIGAHEIGLIVTMALMAINLIPLVFGVESLYGEDINSKHPLIVHGVVEVVSIVCFLLLYFS